MLKYILFDLDGTLTDPKEGICKSVQFALKKANIDEPNLDKLEPFIGPPLKDSFKMFYNMDDDEISMAVVNYRERFSTIGLYENELYTGMEDMLASLKNAGIRLAVASSKPEVFVKKILKYFKIKRFFDVVVGSELDGRRSDKTEVVNEALRQLYGLPGGADVQDYLLQHESVRKETAMVGDRKFDILGAKQFGLLAVGVKFGYAEKGELEKAGADYIAPTVEMLGEYLLKAPQDRAKAKKNNATSSLEDSKSSLLKSVNVIVPLIWYYFIMMLVTFVSLLISNGIKNSGDFAKIMWLTNNSTLISGFIQLIALVLTALALFYLFRKTDELKLSFKSNIFIYLLSGGMIAIALNYILLFIVSTFNIEALKFKGSDLQNNIPFALGMVIFVFLSPVVEELLFRWLIYGRMKKMLNARVSIFVSALFFGFYHGNLLQGIYAFIMGMIMAYLYEKSGTLLASLAFHFGANVFVYSLQHLPLNVQSIFTNILFEIVLLVVGITILFLSREKGKYN